MAKDNVEIAALSDVDEQRMNSTADEQEQFSGRRPRLAVDMCTLLDDPTIDAISIASPNHWHALQTIWSCQAGKDVFVEKPASHNVLEGRKMIEAARKYQRMVQVGTQCRSSPKIREGIEKLWYQLEDRAVNLDLQDPPVAYQTRRQRGFGRPRRLCVLVRGIGGNRIGRLHSRTERSSGNGPSGRLKKITARGWCCIHAQCSRG